VFCDCGSLVVVDGQCRIGLKRGGEPGDERRSTFFAFK
jgi:hypothetical protein